MKINFKYIYNNKTIFKLVATYAHNNAFEIYVLDKIELLRISFLLFISQYYT